MRAEVFADQRGEFLRRFELRVVRPPEHEHAGAARCRAQQGLPGAVDDRDGLGEPLEPVAPSTARAVPVT